MYYCTEIGPKMCTYHNICKSGEGQLQYRIVSDYFEKYSTLLNCTA